MAHCLEKNRYSAASRITMINGRLTEAGHACSWLTPLTEVTLSTCKQDVRNKAILWLVNPQNTDSSGKGLAFKQAI